MLMAAAMLVSFAACGGNKEEETTVAPEATTAENVAGDAAAEEETAEPETEIITEVVTNEEGETEIVTEVVTKEATTKKADKNDKTTAKKETTKKEEPKKTTTEAAKVDDPANWSKAEIIEYANTALDKVKSSRAGFTKRGVMNVNGDVSGLPSWLVNIFKKDNTETFAKGTDTTDIFPAAGFTWSSKLRPQDVEKATIKVNGSTYEIDIRLGTEKNPAKGTASSYGRAVSVIDASEAANMVPGLKAVDMTYHDGYTKITVDSKTGNITYAEISATADAKATVSVIGDVQAKDIKSTEYYTNFVW